MSVVVIVNKIYSYAICMEEKQTMKPCAFHAFHIYIFRRLAFLVVSKMPNGCFSNFSGLFAFLRLLKLSLPLAKTNTTEKK